jgi:YggT family protein
MDTLRQIFCTLLSVYLLVLIARVILSWFPINRFSGPLRTIVGLVYTVTDPPMELVRGLLPMVRFGSMGMDFSPIIIFIVIAILQRAIC